MARDISFLVQFRDGSEPVGNSGKERSRKVDGGFVLFEDPAIYSNKSGQTYTHIEPISNPFNVFVHVTGLPDFTDDELEVLINKEIFLDPSNPDNNQALLDFGWTQAEIDSAAADNQLLPLGFKYGFVFTTSHENDLRADREMTLKSQQFFSNVFNKETNQPATLQDIQNDLQQ